jgi:recombination protein RecA
MATSDAKSKALDSALAKIRKDYGNEAVVDFTGGPKAIEAIPSGSLPLDIALGIGGIPVGRLIEVFGPESSGKTTLCYHLIAEVQKAGDVAAFIDTEHAMDAQYAQALGIDIDKLIVSQPESGEEALNIAEVLTQSGAVKLIVIDSVAALAPRSELEGAIGDSSVGVLARLMSQACRKLRGLANNNDCTILFTNQIREKIGVMFGSPETQPGGRALKFYTSIRLDIRRIETIKEGTDSVANRVRVKVVKNKVAPPYKQAEFEIVFGTGIDRYASLLDFGQQEGIELVQKAGAFYTFVSSGEKRQGAAKSKQYLRESPEVADEIEAQVRKVYFSPPDEEEIEKEADKDKAPQLEEEAVGADD